MVLLPIYKGKALEVFISCNPGSTRENAPVSGDAKSYLVGSEYLISLRGKNGIGTPNGWNMLC